MDDEFALCWNNFQDNIASGFQNLYDRGDLVDVTLACDGRLLHAHKIVLAICSPYFQEIFISNPCKHPIIILKDVTHGVMCELLQFMYQGVVNVKHTELQAFMKIAQLLQIKGLASSGAAPHKSPSQLQTLSSATAVQNTSTSSTSGGGGGGAGASASGGGGGGSGSGSVVNQSHKHTSGINTAENNNVNDGKNNVPAPSSSSSTSSPSPMPFSHIKSPPENLNPFQTGPGLKRLPEYSTESLSIYSRKQYRRNTDSSEHDMCPDSMDHVNPDDNFLQAIPHISMAERFDPNSVKRENNDHTSSPVGLRNSLPPHFGFDYNIYKNNPDYPSDLHLPNDYSKSFGNHMDIPPSGGNVTMLSSTSLLHANCVFNRNNTVATQQGMKTYWLCKSYRISMCRARCITHQGRVISATGVHNHPPHMRNVAGGLEMMPPQQNNSSLMAPNSSANLMQIPTSSANLNNTLSNIRLPQSATNLSQHNMSVMNHQQQQQQQQPPQPTPPHHHHLPQGIPTNPPPHHQMHQNAPSHHHHQTQHISPHSQSSVIQNMMHNVNLMHLSNMAPMLNTQHSPQMNSMQPQTHHHQSSHHQIPQPPSSLEITPILNESPCINSPSNRSSNPSQIENIDSPMHSSAVPSGSGGVALESPSQGSDGNGSSHVPDATASLVPNSAVSPDDISNNCQDSHNSSQHSHIISSITISPGSAHNFKIENM